MPEVSQEEEGQFEMPAAEVSVPSLLSLAPREAQQQGGEDRVSPGSSRQGGQVRRHTRPQGPPPSDEDPAPKSPCLPLC